MVKKTLIKQRWQSYFHKLLRGEGDRDMACLDDLEHSKRHQNFGHHRFIKVEEVKCAISIMNKGRVTKPN